MLDKLLIALRDNKDAYLNAKQGSEFEDRIKHYLKGTLGFTQIFRDQISDADWRVIKTHVCDKLGTEFMDVPNDSLKRTFIYQPYGSQNPPDFIVFTDTKVVPIEVKYSMGASVAPMWNSNVPRANIFYIFGSYGVKDLTFFIGADIVTEEHRRGLYAFFDGLRKTQEEIRLTMPALDATDRGFTPYIRMAFAQGKHKSSVQVNFFTHPKRAEVERLAIEKAELL